MSRAAYVNEDKVKLARAVCHIAYPTLQFQAEQVAISAAVAAILRLPSFEPLLCKRVQ